MSIGLLVPNVLSVLPFISFKVYNALPELEASLGKLLRCCRLFLVILLTSSSLLSYNSTMGQDDAITVRKATAEDVLAITELHNSVIEEGLLTWDSPRTEEQTLQWLRYLEDLRYPLLLAVSDGVVVGCAAFEPVWEDTCPGNSFEYSAKLHLLVTKHHRKDGIGSRLFEELCRDQKTLHRKLYRIESQSARQR